MGKTFALTAVAMAAVIGLGGGVFNMIKVGDVEAGEFFTLILLLLPLAVALTLPIAALFSAAATYGRLSADNEFVACRASGINLHRLFLPCVVLSVVSAGITFVCINFVLPGMVRRIEEFIWRDPVAYIEQRLKRPKGLAIGNYRLYADQLFVPEPGFVELRPAVFVEIKDDDWKRYGTAERVVLGFRRIEDEVELTLNGFEMSYYDREAKHSFHEGEGQLEAERLPFDFAFDVKFLKLGQLLYYWRNPTDWFEVRRRIDELRAESVRWERSQELWSQWQERASIRLAGESTETIMTAGAAEFVERDGSIRLTDVSVDHTHRGRNVRYRADAASVEVPRIRDAHYAEVRVVLYGASDARSAEPNRSGGRIQLGPYPVDRSFLQSMAERPVESLMTGSGAGEPVQRARDAVEESRAMTLRTVATVVHQRMSFSVSVLVLVLLAAALGIIRRGGHLLTAFGISFIPALGVIVAIVMGKQLAEKAGTHVVGISLMWSGIALVILLDVIVLWKVLRR